LYCFLIAFNTAVAIIDFPRPPSTENITVLILIFFIVYIVIFYSVI
jgi:hypothetical protein